MLISRGAVGDQIVESFTGRYAMTHTYLIEGIRGSGKTVLMTTIAKKLEKEKEWIVINLNSTRNLLEDLADGLEYSVRQFPDIFKQGMSVSVADFGFGVNGNGQPANVIGRIEDILRLLQKKEKRLLITIDEVALDDNMRIFASQFQIFLREDFPVLFRMIPSLPSFFDAPRRSCSLSIFLQLSGNIRWPLILMKIRRRPLHIQRKGMPLLFRLWVLCIGNTGPACLMKRLS